MEMASKYRKELSVLQSKFAHFRTEWQQHLSWVEARINAIEKECPYSLASDSRATKQALSGALYRLSAIETMLVARHTALNADHTRSERPSLGDIIVSSINRPPVGSETRHWRLVRTTTEAETAFKRERRTIRKAEEHLSKQIENIQTLLVTVSENVKSEDFVIVCQAQRMRESVQHVLSERHNLPFARHRSLERQLDVFLKCMGQDADPHSMFVSIEHILSKLGLKLPRQTLITEYFSSETEDDDDNEAEEEDVVSDSEDEIDDQVDYEEEREGRVNTINEPDLESSAPISQSESADDQKPV